MADGAIHIPNATPFDLISEDADSWLTEARHWADGTAIETQDQADAVSRIIEGLRLSAKAADDARKEENRPFDDAKAAVQAKYAPLFAPTTNKEPGRVFKAIDALKVTLTGFLRKQDEIKREAQRAAREEADRIAEEARAALRNANAANLAEREAAEDLAKQAEQAERAAKAAGKDKAHATGGTRAVGLRTRTVAKVTDLNAAVRFYWSENPQAFADLVQRLADDDARQNRRVAEGRGVTFTEERSA